MAEKLRCTLTLEGIDALSETLNETLATARLSRKERLRLRLMAEEIMLGWLNGGLADAPCTLTDDKRFGRRTLILRAQGATEDDADPMLSSAFAAELAGQGASFAVTHAATYTSAAISLPAKQRSDLFRLCAAIVLALAVSLLMRLLPANISETVVTNAVTPMISLFTQLLSALAMPLLFFSLLSSIISLENLRDQGMVIRSLAKRLVVGLAVTAVIACLLAMLFYGVQPDGTAEGGTFAPIASFLQNAVPIGVMTPLIFGNVLQIAFLAAVSGFSMLMLKGKLPVLESASQQLNELFQQTMQLLMRLLPAFVFLAVIGLFRSAGLTALGDVGKLLLFMVAMCLALLLFSAVMVGLSFKRNPMPVIKKMLMIFLLSFTSGASASSYSAMDDLLTEGYGLRPRYVRLVLPFGLALVRLARVSTFIAVYAFCATACGVPITPSALVMISLTSMVLSFATPSVFGGVLASCALMLEQFGLPLELLAIIAVLEILLERMTNACDMVTMLSILLCTARATRNMTGDADRSGANAAKAAR